MKKKLALLLSLLSVMAVSSIGFAGCGKKGGGTGSSSSQHMSSEDVVSSETESSSEDVVSSETESSSEDVVSSETESSSEDVVSSETESSSEEEKVPSLTLDQATLALGQYTSGTLTATLANAEDTIEWSSSNDAVAKVEDGVVTAFGAGEAVITATAGDLTATCTVTVTESTVAFAALDDEMEIIKGIYEDLDLTVELNGEEMADVTVSVATEGDKVSVEEDEGAYALVGAEYGTQTVTVTATWKGVTVAEKTVSVTVIEYGALIVDLPENKLDLIIGAEGYDLSNISVIINDVAVENPTFTTATTAETVAKVEDGKIVAVGAGRAEITVSYTTEQDTYDTVISVTVTKKVIAKEVNFLVDGSAGQYGGSGGLAGESRTGVAAIDLSATGLDLSKVEKVVCTGREVEFSVSGSTLTLTDAPGGYQIYTLETATEDYTIDGCVYAVGISTFEDLEAWRTKEHWGYTVLLNDIDCGGAMLGKPTNNVCGILDGLGHTISNFVTDRGFINQTYSAVGLEGGLVNLQFVNVLADCSNGVVPILARYMYGRVENVVVQGKLVNVGEKEHTGALFIGASGNSQAHNIVANVYSDGTKNHYVLGSHFENIDAISSRISNVHCVCNASVYIPSTHADYIKKYASESEMISAVDFSTWAYPWTTDENGVPMMSDYTDDMANPAVLATGTAHLGGTISFTDTSLVPLTYTLDGYTNGITIENDVVTIGMDATVGSSFDVVVSCEAYPEFSKKFEYTIAKEKVAIVGEYLVKGSSENKWSYDTGDSTIDLSAVEGLDLSQVTKVLCGDEEITYSVSGSSLTFVNAPGGLHEYTLITPSADYSLNVCVYVLGISTKDELEAWRTSESFWYAVLLNDIDYQGATLGDGANVLGILDGRGYSIKNFTYTKGFVKCLFDAKSIIKNVKFSGATQDCTGMGKYPDYGIFGQWQKGTIENVYLDITTTNMDEGAEHIATICYGLEAGATIKNVVVDLKNANGNFHYAMNQDNGASKVGVVGGYEGAKGSSEGAGAEWGTNGGFHGKISWMITEEANDELLTFFDCPYWHIDKTAGTIDLKPVAQANADAE